MSPCQSIKDSKSFDKVPDPDRSGCYPKNVRTYFYHPAKKVRSSSKSKSLPQQTADLEEQLESRFSPTGQQVRKECFGNAQRARYLPLVTMLNTAKGS